MLGAGDCAKYCSDADLDDGGSKAVVLYGRPYSLLKQTPRHPWRAVVGPRAHLTQNGVLALSFACVSAERSFAQGASSRQISSGRDFDIPYRWGEHIQCVSVSRVSFSLGVSTQFLLRHYEPTVCRDFGGRLTARKSEPLWAA